MKQFLIELKVPDHRIQCLLGSDLPISGSPLTPSRANIVNVVNSLADNAEIQRGDNIIIYYAAHGSSYDATGSCSDSIWQAMSPIDRNAVDANERWTPDISDRELDNIFTPISYAKGCKITFFADCCCAAGMSRGPLSLPGLHAMNPTHYSDVQDMLRAAHNRLQHTPNYRSVLLKGWQPDTSSHVSNCGGMSDGDGVMREDG